MADGFPAAGELSHTRMFNAVPMFPVASGLLMPRSSLFRPSESRPSVGRPADEPSLSRALTSALVSPGWALGPALGSMPFFAFSASVQSRHGYPLTISIAIHKPPESVSGEIVTITRPYVVNVQSHKRERLAASRNPKCLTEATFLQFTEPKFC